MPHLFLTLTCLRKIEANRFYSIATSRRWDRSYSRNHHRYQEDDISGALQSPYDKKNNHSMNRIEVYSMGHSYREYSASDSGRD